MNAPHFLIETGWREDLQMLVIVLFAAAIVAIICEAVVCFTRPGSKVGDWFVSPMVIAIGVAVGAGIVLGVRVSETPMNDAYWKTYQVEGRVLAADYAELTDGSASVPMALLEVPGNGPITPVNMSSNSLQDYIDREVTLDCVLVQTDNGAMDHLCTFVGVYQEAEA